MSTDTRLVRIETALEAKRQQFLSVLPPQLPYHKFARYLTNAYHEVGNLNKCPLDTILRAGLNCAALGLEPNSPLHQAAIVPFWNDKKKTYEAQLLVEYRGLLRLTWNAREILDVQDSEVRKNDRYKAIRGRGATLEHEKAEGDRGEIIRFYACANLRGGGFVFEDMTLAEVQEHRKKFSKKLGGVSDEAFGDDVIWYGKKTVLRKLLSRYVPQAVAPVEAMEAAYSEGRSPILIREPTGQVVTELEPEEDGQDDAIEAEITGATAGQPTQTEPQPEKPRRGRPPKDRSQEAQAAAPAPQGQGNAPPPSEPPKTTEKAPEPPATPASGPRAASEPMRGVTVPPGFKGWPGPTRAAFLADLEEKRGYKIDPGSVIEEAIPSRLAGLQGMDQRYGLPAKQQEAAAAESTVQPDRPLSPPEIEELQGAARTAGVPWKWIKEAVIHYMAPFSTPERTDGFDAVEDVPVSFYDDLMAFCQGERGRPQQGKW